MTVREMIFQYRESGARSVAKKDRAVRESIQKTGRTAERESGKVQRWLDRNKKAINALSVATLAAVGAILSAAPAMRAQLGGVRAAFTLLSTVLLRDVLPAGTNLGSVALDLVDRFRDLDESIRRPISAIVLVGGAIVGLLPVIAALIKSAAAVGGALGSVVSVLSGVVAAAKTAVVAIAAITGAAVSTVAAIGVLIAAVAALATAFLVDFRGIRTKTLGFLSDLLTGAHTRLMALLSIARDTAAAARDRVVNAIRRLVDGALSILGRLRDGAGRLMSAAADRILNALRRARSLGSSIVDRLRRGILGALDLAGQLGSYARGWVSAMVSGVRDRASRLADAFRSMASRVASAFKDRFNSIIPSSISIPSVTISIPDFLGGGSRSIGGGSLDIPQLNTGGRIASDGLAMLHAGERIMPAAQVRERGPQPTGGDTVTVDTVNIMVQGSGDGRVDGRNVAREFERELSDRGA